MVIVALVLLIVIAVFSVAIVVSNPEIYELSLFRVLVPVTSAGVYFTGMGAALLVVVAALLLRLGIRRSRERRQRLRTAEQASIGSAPRTTPGRSESSPVTSDIPADAEPSPSTSRPADDPDAPESGPTSNLELDPPTAATPAERQALPDDVDEISRDEPKR